MKRIWKFLADREPTATAEVIRLLLLALVSFGLPLSEGQQVSLMAFFSVALSWATRRRVTPPDPGDTS